MQASYGIQDFAPMDYIPSVVNLTVYDTGQISVEHKVSQSFMSMVESGEIKLSVGSIFRFDDIVEARKLIDSSKASGNISRWLITRCQYPGYIGWLGF